ncbi:MAG TPA: LacI family DNA-binding transcriptional regulator [Stackebrandtia sp.]|uniref:LacI family DNA-binding transcriptional regulator n=1 Tax=Stackebrandtia sp. TaxID=2023065 RepID=UPI002D37DB95|nr:LacI family DNA-binding transcriptional regulator [Stackebrandtia sp.]HZE41463.1 LacI family DNA-binding transcriptional regulator [Stackebrandtia sp.]
MATIADVAARAGLSTATVSRALNGVSTVDPQLVNRVREAVRELGYQPHGPARNLRRRRTDVLGLIISDVENPFFTAIARGVEDVARDEGYSVVLCNSDEDADKERRYLDVAAAERMAGVIISPTSATSHSGVPTDGTPVVAVDRPLPAGSGDCVLVDTREAANEATGHLLGRGWGRVACLTGPEGLATADDRLAGYRDALRAAALPFDPALVRRAPYRADGAREATRDLCATPIPPDGLLIANSAMAIGALEALRDNGLRPGRDIGVVAFDDAPWATLVDPPLTVVAQPAYDLGTTATRLLLARIADRARPSSTTILGARLIARASSAER